MKLSVMKSTVIALFLFAATAFCGATTVTIGPTGNYASMCAASTHLTDGETVTVDANSGTPYNEGDCTIKANNLTIVGINGRPILDGSGKSHKAIWIMAGHDDVVDNFEFRNGNYDIGANTDAILAEIPGTGKPNAGGNLTVQHCYIHDNDQGILVDNAGTFGSVSYGNWYSTTPYFTFQYNEIAYNGVSSGPETGQNHNVYIGWDVDGTATATFQFSWTHDALVGHALRSREEITNFYYNLIDDIWGQTSFEVDLPNGGSAYVVGNIIYKSPVTNSNSNSAIMMAYREGNNNVNEPMNATQDLHFVNNTVIDDSSVSTRAFMLEECFTESDQTQCPAPIDGAPALTTPGVFENNIFMGFPAESTNDLAAYSAGNVSYFNTEPTPANLALLDFANPAALDFHILSGSPAIGAGIYPPTDNTGTADPLAKALYEYTTPMLAGRTRPTPTGSTMDAGAFSYPPPTLPSLGLVFSPTTITAPGTGTITVSGLPTPPVGTFNYAASISTNRAVLTAESAASSTTSVTMPYQTYPVASSTVVPVNVYADGEVVSGNVTVNPGPALPYSITLDNLYEPFTTVNLEGPAPAGGTVVTLSSSDTTVGYVPATVTVPAGQMSAEMGTLLGSAWGSTPSKKPVTLTATVGSTSAQSTYSFHTSVLAAFKCYSNPCAAVQGGGTYPISAQINYTAPLGGAVITITSSNTTAIPNQSYTAPQGTEGGFQLLVNTNTVTSSQTATLTASYNGVVLSTNPITVDPNNPAASITVTSGNNQSANVGTAFANDLVVTVYDSGGLPVAGVAVTFTPGTGISILSGQYTTGGAGGAYVVAEPTQAGSLSLQATVAGVSTPATFSLTGLQTAASIAVVSGSGQSSNVGTPFTNPLVAIVKDSSGSPVSGVLVTFAGTGVSFPSGNTATTAANGEASVTAEPTATGSLTVDATVSGVGSPAVFSETGTSPVSISSITLDVTYQAGTTVHLTAAAPAGGTVVTLNSSDATVLYAPSSVTVPSGQTSAETGSLLGSFWGQSPASKTATITGTDNGTAQLSVKLHTPYITHFNCTTSCSVVGGNSVNMNTAISAPGSPYGGGTMTFTSSNTAVIPNQSVLFNAGQQRSVDGNSVPLTTNAVATSTNVTVTAGINGSTSSQTITVNP